MLDRLVDLDELGDEARQASLERHMAVEVSINQKRLLTVFGLETDVKAFDSCEFVAGLDRPRCLRLIQLR